jgi:hypothetical protein
MGSLKFPLLFEELFALLKNIVQFYLMENVYHAQRRFGKCDAFGKLDSEQ